MPSLRALAGRRPPRRLVVFVLLLLLVAAVAAIPVGRWEGHRATAKQQRGIDRVRAAIGPDILGMRLSGVAQVGALECLLYRAGDYIYALELCVDSTGRLVRAVDATGVADAQSWDITATPAAAAVLLQPGHLHDPSAVLDRREALREAIAWPHVVGVACFDSVAALVTRPQFGYTRAYITQMCAATVDLTRQSAEVTGTLGAARIAKLLTSELAIARAELAIAREALGLTRGQLIVERTALKRRHLQARTQYEASIAKLAAARRALDVVG